MPTDLEDVQRRIDEAHVNGAPLDLPPLPPPEAYADEPAAQGNGHDSEARDAERPRPAPTWNAEIDAYADGGPALLEQLRERKAFWRARAEALRMDPDAD